MVLAHQRNKKGSTSQTEGSGKQTGCSLASQALLLFKLLINEMHQFKSIFLPAQGSYLSGISMLEVYFHFSVG